MIKTTHENPLPSPSLKLAGVDSFSNSPPSTVSLHEEGEVCTLTLNRPEHYNALNRQMAADLLLAVKSIASREDIQVLVIRGSGKGFCAGGDVGFVASYFPRVEAAIREFLEDFHSFLMVLRTMPQIVITSVHGAAAGAGLSLASMGDLCVAASDARFVPAYSQLGVSPDCGGSIGIPAAIGVRRSMQLLLCESEITSEHALSWGLVNYMVPAAELIQQTDVLAKRIARVSPQATRETKRLLYRADSHSFSSQLEAELEALVRCADTEVYRNAVRKFLGQSA